jgi:hypothetical protein
MVAVAAGTPCQFILASTGPLPAARKGELKAAEIAGAAGAYTLPISCTATEQAENAKR